MKKQERERANEIFSEMQELEEKKTTLTNAKNVEIITSMQLGAKNQNFNVLRFEVHGLENYRIAVNNFLQSTIDLIEARIGELNREFDLLGAGNTKKSNTYVSDAEFHTDDPVLFMEVCENSAELDSIGYRKKSESSPVKNIAFDYNYLSSLVAAIGTEYGWISVYTDKKASLTLHSELKQ